VRSLKENAIAAPAESKNSKTEKCSRCRLSHHHQTATKRTPTTKADSAPAPLGDITANTITPSEFDALKARYAGMGLGEQSEYTIFEVGVENSDANERTFAFSEQGLKDALAWAEFTDGKSLIVIRSTNTQHTLNLNSYRHRQYHQRKLDDIQYWNFSPLILARRNLCHRHYHHHQQHDHRQLGKCRQCCYLRRRDLQQ